MFLQECVCLLGGGDPHVTITDDALDLTVQVPHPLSPPDIRLGTPLTSDVGTLLVTSGDHWRPVQACSFREIPK